MNAQPVIFFDGVCNLCNASVQFTLERDKHKYFQFTALQGNYAKEHLPQSITNSNQLNSIVLLDHGKVYQKSSAALRIAKKLSGFWPLMYGFIIVPKFIRDWVYDIIAKNRYKWWGKQESCWMPTPDLKSRFYE